MADKESESQGSQESSLQCDDFGKVLRQGEPVPVVDHLMY